MTITDQLQFSVLTAPVATLDRRTLSQAWYSALYGDRAPTAPKKLPACTQACEETPHHQRATHTPASGSAQRAASLRVPRAAHTDRAEGVGSERRAPRSALARKIERAFLRSRSTHQKASFTVDGDHGRVHVVLQGHGTQLKLIAICPPKARPQVAAALAQARYALAQRGIDLDTETRGAAPC